MERILSWRHTGFLVHILVRAKTKPVAERVGKYMIRSVLSLDLRSLSPDAHGGGELADLDGRLLEDGAGGPEPRDLEARRARQKRSFLFLAPDLSWDRADEGDQFCCLTQ